MLKRMEDVAVFESSKEYNGTVLGSEGDLFWLLVLDLNEVHRGHLDNLYQLPGKKFLSAAEWITSVEDVFDAGGEFSSNVFWHSKEPGPMIGLLKAYRIIGALKAGDP